jgi:N utilization substance protein B
LPRIRGREEIIGFFERNTHIGTLAAAEVCMKRRLAREIAVSSLYQMEMNEVTAAEAVDMLMEELSQENEIGADPSEAGSTAEFARELVNGVQEHRQAIDGMLQQYLTGWQVLTVRC